MKRRRKRDIIIELTSLLDVIMIMIFMVMAENSKLISEKQNALDAARTENAANSAVLGELRGENSELSAELAEALGKLDEGSADELLDKLHAAESRLDAYQYMDDVIIVLNIGLENSYSNTVRRLSFGDPAKAESGAVIEIHNNDELETALNRMRVFLSEYTLQAANDQSGSTIAYMIFSYDPRRVFQDDYAAVDKALNDLEHKANSGNVRYRINSLDNE